MISVFVYDAATGAIIQHLVGDPEGVAAVIQPGQAAKTSQDGLDTNAHYVSPQTGEYTPYPEKPPGNVPVDWDGYQWVPRGT